MFVHNPSGFSVLPGGKHFHQGQWDPRWKLGQLVEQKSRLDRDGTGSGLPALHQHYSVTERRKLGGKTECV